MLHQLWIILASSRKKNDGPFDIPFNFVIGIFHPRDIRREYAPLPPARVSPASKNNFFLNNWAELTLGTHSYWPEVHGADWSIGKVGLEFRNVDLFPKRDFISIAAVFS